MERVEKQGPVFASWEKIFPWVHGGHVWVDKVEWALTDNPQSREDFDREVAEIERKAPPP